MRILAFITITLYAILLITIGAILVALSMELITIDQVSGLVYHLYQVPKLKIIMGSIGGVLIIITLVSVKMILVRIQKQKTIAFANSFGQVSIALSAIEDLIKKIAIDIPEVKDMRSDVKASKKGLNVFCRTELWAGAHIPEVTEKIQYRVKDQLQSLLGIEEEIKVMIHIVKIRKQEETREKKVEKEQSIRQFRGIEYREE